MNSNYYFSVAALHDIEIINDYLLEKYASKFADQFLDALLMKCDRLVQFPIDSFSPIELVDSDLD